MNNLSPEKQNVFGWGINERLSNGDIQISPLSNPRMTIAFVASNASHGEASKNYYPCQVIADSNAKLISAAPQLLAALERAVELYGKGGGPWNVPGEPGSWLSEARSAISKAKGE